MNKISTIFFLLFFLFYYHHAQTQSFVLRGRVVKPDYTPVSGVKVFIENFEPATSNINGEFAISIPQDIGNPKNVRIIRDGLEYKQHVYRPIETSFPLEIIVDVPIRILSGKVVYKDGKGVINASISLKEGVLKDSVHTDNLGYFRMLLPEGINISMLVDKNLILVNGKEVRKENTRMEKANFIQVRLVENQAVSLYTIAVYDKYKKPITSSKVSIDGTIYNLNRQGFIKTNNPNLKKSVITVEGFKILGTPLFNATNNFIEIYVEKQPVAANGTIKENNKNDKETNELLRDEVSNTSIVESTIRQDSSKLKYEGEISIISLNIENSRRDFENNNKGIADKLEQLSKKLSSDVNITPAQIDALKYQLGDLEKILAANDASYEKTKMQTQSLLSKLKEAILQKDSIGRELLAAEKAKKELEQEKKNIEIERKEEEANFKMQLWTVSSVSVMLTALLLMVYIFSNRIKKQKKEVEKTKNELVEKVQEIEQKNTQLRATLDELKKAQAQLVSAEKMASLGQLTAGIAHEINNPVNFTYAGALSLKTDFSDLIRLLEQYRQITVENVASVLPLAKGVEKEIAYPEIKEEIDGLLVSIKRGAERTAEIVKSLRTFARLDEDTFKKVDIEENLNATLVMLNSQYKDRIEIVKQYGKIPQVECFPGQMNQVFMNILLNAVQATKGDGKIFISTSYPSVHADSAKYKEAVEISIRDTGMGMSEEVKKNIFEPFFTTKDVGSGSGLGLSVSFGILEKHKGEIKVFSEVGKGSEFVIILPLNALQVQTNS